MTLLQVKRSAILICSVLVSFTVLSCSAEPKAKPKSLMESQQKVLEGAKAIEAQLQEAEEKRRKQNDSL